MPSSTITAKGQTTIPKAVRERLGVEAGDRVDFVIRPDGHVTIEAAVQAVGRLKGLLRGKGRRPVSVEDMHAAIRRRASGRR
jgi:AbrB family looped-hinge helix DNA binding protein